jgi:AraC-like DNA-binding protein
VKYSEFLPIEPLAPFVKKLWYCSSENMLSTVLTIPLLHHELVFNFSDFFEIKRPGEDNFVLKDLPAWVSGLQYKSCISYSAGRHEMVGVLFRIHGLKAFTKMDVVEFKDNFIDADLVFGKSLNTLIEQIHASSVITAKIDLIQQFLLSNLTLQKFTDYLFPSLEKISSYSLRKGQISQISSDSFITNKSLIHAFRKHVGISPAKLLQLSVINKVVQSLSKDPGQSLTKLAYEFDFFDQAHCNRLFKTITSLTPSQYASLALKEQVDSSSYNFVSLG